MNDFERFIFDLKEQRDMLIGQIAFWEKGAALRMIGETAEVTRSRSLARLREQKVELDDLIPKLEAMRTVQRS